MGFVVPFIVGAIKTAFAGYLVSKAIQWLAPKPELPDFQQDEQAQV